MPLERGEVGDVLLVLRGATPVGVRDLDTEMRGEKKSASWEDSVIEGRRKGGRGGVEEGGNATHLSVRKSVGSFAAGLMTAGPLRNEIEFVRSRVRW